jgi:hypothetical protein
MEHVTNSAPDEAEKPEFVDEIRVPEAGSDTVVEPSLEVPVSYDVDVVIAGGGISGVFAGIAAGRLGAKTLLIDRFGYPGGNMGPGMFVGGSLVGYNFDKNAQPDWDYVRGKTKRKERIVVPFPGVRGGFSGIPKEFMERFGSAGGAYPPYKQSNYMRDSLTASQVSMEMLEEAGVEMLLSAYASDPIMDGTCVKGIFYEGKGGRHAARASVVVDATGEADVSRRAGAPAIYPKESYNDWDSHSPAGMGIWAIIAGLDVERYDAYVRDEKDLFKLENREVEGIGTMAIFGNANNLYGKTLYRDEGLCGTRVQVLRPHQRIDASNAKHVARMEAEVRKYLFDSAQALKGNVPGYENSYLMLVSPYLSVRGALYRRGIHPDMGRLHRGTEV